MRLSKKNFLFSAGAHVLKEGRILISSRTPRLWRVHPAQDTPMGVRRETRRSSEAGDGNVCVCTPYACVIDLTPEVGNGGLATYGSLPSGTEYLGTYLPTPACSFRAPYPSEAVPANCFSSVAVAVSTCPPTTAESACARRWAVRSYHGGMGRRKWAGDLRRGVCAVSIANLAGIASRLVRKNRQRC